MGFFMGNSLFITGTDTGVGKSVITGLLGRYLREKSVDVVTQKWVQCGPGHDLDVHDVLMDQEGADKDCRNPYFFRMPASPHLAARAEDKSIDKHHIFEQYYRLSQQRQMVLIEGAGGILVPLTETFLMADLVQELGLPVLVVAENRLGAINQVLMTLEVLKARNIDVAGVIFNQVKSSAEDVDILNDNLVIVREFSGQVPVLGSLPFSHDRDLLYDGVKDCFREFILRLF